MELSPGLATALVPLLGHEHADAIATQALQTGVSVHDIVLAQGLLDR